VKYVAVAGGTDGDSKSLLEAMQPISCILNRSAQ
jgi:hypothetical protein